MELKQQLLRAYSTSAPAWTKLQHSQPLYAWHLVLLSHCLLLPNSKAAWDRNAVTQVLGTHQHLIRQEPGIPARQNDSLWGTTVHILRPPSRPMTRLTLEGSATASTVGSKGVAARADSTAPACKWPPIPAALPPTVALGAASPCPVG